MKNIENEIILILSKSLKINKKNISINSSIDNLEGWDSFSQISIILEIEKKFKIKFSNNDIISSTSIKKLVKLVKKSAKKK